MMWMGSTRWVFLLGGYAIKIPSLCGPMAFWDGLSANLTESYQWHASRDDRLCPVIFSFFGLLLIMRRAADYSDKDYNDWWYFHGLLVDPHYDNIGIIGGRLVLRDYGTDYGHRYCPSCCGFTAIAWEPRDCKCTNESLAHD